MWFPQSERKQWRHPGKWNIAYDRQQVFHGCLVDFSSLIAGQNTGAPLLDGQDTGAFHLGQDSLPREKIVEASIGAQPCLSICENLKRFSFVHCPLPSTSQLLNVPSIIYLNRDFVSVLVWFSVAMINTMAKNQLGEEKVYFYLHS